MTPIIDLTFLLLIAFIVTYPSLEQAIKVKLPRGSASRIDEAKSISVTLDHEGRVYLDSVPVGYDELEARFADAIRENPDVALLIRGDEDLAYGRIVEVLRIAKNSNIVRMALVTEAESSTRHP
ncbi:MAG: ExbD/TolR family protein [Kiritimatiellia bacterium]